MKISVITPVFNEAANVMENYGSEVESVNWKDGGFTARFVTDRTVEPGRRLHDSG